MENILIDKVLKSNGWIEIHNSLHGYRASANWETKNYGITGEGKQTLSSALVELELALGEYKENWPPKE